MPVIVSGSGSLTTDGGAFAIDEVGWTEASAPNLTKSVSFSIAFGNALSIECDRIAWSSVANRQLVNVSDACVLIDGNTGAEAHLTDAMLTATSTIDAGGQGTLTVRFGVPDQTVTLVNGDLAATSAEVAVDVLVFDVSFAHTECSSGCSSSAFDFSDF
jgi:hypothetical protein